MSQFKHQALEQIKSIREEKPLNGPYLKGTKEKDVDQGKTHNWLIEYRWAQIKNRRLHHCCPRSVSY